jgi:hypothetical protein
MLVALLAICAELGITAGRERDGCERHSGISVSANAVGHAPARLECLGASSVAHLGRRKRRPCSHTLAPLGRSSTYEGETFRCRPSRPLIGRPKPPTLPSPKATR